MKRFVLVMVLVAALIPMIAGCGGDSASDKQPKMTGEPKPGGVGPAEVPAAPGGGKAGGGAKTGSSVN